MKTETEIVYSIIFELISIKGVTIPISMETKLHASFLNLVGQFNPALSARMHDEPGYRPYTISPISGGKTVGDRMNLRGGQPCHLRITVLDGGALWDALQVYFREAEPIYMHLDNTDFRLVRMFIASTTDSWSGQVRLLGKSWPLCQGSPQLPCILQLQRLLAWVNANFVFSPNHLWYGEAFCGLGTGMHLYRCIWRNRQYKNHLVSILL